MPISSTTRKAGPFYGNDSTVAFPFDYKVFTETDVSVLRACALGVEVEQTIDVDYSITLNEDQDNTPGGVVTLAAPLSTGCTLVLLSAVPDLQPIEFVNQGGFFPEDLNGGLDRGVALVQQIKERLGRTISLPATAAADISLQIPTPAPGQILVWDALGKALTLLDPASLISIVAFGSARADTFDGNGSTTAFNLTSSPGSLYNMTVSIDGVVQVPGEDYAWGGSTLLSFVVPPPAGTRILVRYQIALPEAGGGSVDLSGLATTNGSNINATAFRSALSLDQVNNTSDAAKPVSTAQQAALNLKVSTALIGAANGVAALGPDGLVPSAQLPASGSYKGSWNATTNTPTITSGVGANGDFYIVGTAGTTTIDGVSSWAIGDQVRYNGSTWQKIANNAAVSSVAGKTGAITLVPADIAGVAALAGSTFTGLVSAPTSRVGAQLMLETTGGAPAPAFVVDFNNFKIAPRSTITEASVPLAAGQSYSKDCVDVDRRRLGYGADIFEKILIQPKEKTFGWLNETVGGMVILTNAPANGLTWNPILGAYVPVTAEVLGAIPPNVIAFYEGGFESSSVFIRNYGTEANTKTVTGYTQFTVSLTNPLADDEFRPTMWFETNHNPPFRGQGQSISGDRRTVTVHSWYAKGNGAYGQVPTGTTSCRVNPNYTAYTMHSISELGDELWVMPGAPTVPVAPSTPGAMKVRYRDQESIYSTWEIGLRNKKGVLNYNGDLPSGVKGQTGRDNWVAGIEVVDDGPFRSAYAFRGRGPTHRHFVSRDVDNASFVVEKGFDNRASTGFRTEADHSNFVPLQVAPGDDVRFAIFNSANVDVGSKTVAGTRVFSWFSAGDGAADATLSVLGGDATGLTRGTVQWAAGQQVYLGEDGTPQFRVGNVAGSTDYLSVTGSNGLGAQLSALSPNSLANIVLLPKGDGTVVVAASSNAQALSVTGGGVNRLNVNNSGFVFGPSGSEWASYTSSAFLAGPTSDPWVFANTSGVVLARATNIARSGGGAYSLSVTPVASAANNIDIRANTSGFGPVIKAQGSDTNVDLVFETKNAGKIWLGPVNGVVDTPIAAYMEVKDNVGNVRKLAIIA